MTPELQEKLERLGYQGEVLPGEEQIPMLFVDGRFICGLDYALSLSDEQLKALIDETVQAGGEQS
jgi:hypothetical protein